MPKLTEKKAQDWLDQNFPQYKILEWGGSGKDKSKFLDLDRNVEFIFSFTKIKDVLKNRPTNIFNPSKEELKEKRKQIFQNKYGVDHFFQLESIKKKREQTNLDKYGVKNPTQTEKVKQKIKQTNNEKYGFNFAIQNDFFKNKKEQTNLDKYGHPCPAIALKHKTILTNLEKYGVDNPMKSEDFRIKKGITKLYERKTADEWIEDLGISRSHFLYLVREYGFEFAKQYKKTKTSIELIIENILDDLGLQWEYNKKLGNYFPDYTIEDKKLIIECDGLFWHSDSVQPNRNYHLSKKLFYKNIGYKSLFFREDEIKNKSDIIKSIISNSSHIIKNKVFARKAEISFSKDISFFEKNHLMGKGRGDTFFLVYNKQKVCGIQFFKRKNSIYISRFCPKINYSIPGGYSRLIKAILNQDLNVDSIETFVDKRYGDGTYLYNLGFELETEYLSFKWTNFKETFGRMKFKGNKGKELGLSKIWDCGQAKYVYKV